MSEKRLVVPFTKEQVQKISQKVPTPFYIYDERGIRDVSKRLYKAFGWVQKGFKNYYAVKALPNPSVIQVLKEEGMGVDCSSLPELLIAEKLGFKGEDIFMTSNDTPPEEFKKAYELGAIINLDDITHIEALEKAVGKLPQLICFRYNPGPLREGNEIIGNPADSKYGLTTEQIYEAYKICKQKGVKRFALHTMIVSNMRDPEYLIETGRMMFQLAVDIHKKTGVKIELINLGGGIGIPYKPEDKEVDLEYVSNGIKKAYDKIIKPSSLGDVKVVMESGRAVTGPYGYLVTKVRYVMTKYHEYAGVDACMANLMRHALYGAYHPITVLGKESNPKNKIYSVVGSLCENNDRLATNRELPELAVDDILVIHQAGAHGYAMGFNYNGKLRPQELLLRGDGSVERIRRAETVDDHFATLTFQADVLRA